MVSGSDLDWTIVRPPAIYGPGDKEMLEMFAMAARGLVLLPPDGRLSILHVDDLARLLIALAGDRRGMSSGQLYEVDDATPGGWTHRDFGAALGRAVGRRARVVSLPRVALMLVAQGDRLVRRDRAKLTPDRARYFCHADWVADHRRWAPSSLWTPAIDAETGLAETAAAYRAKGWLRRR